MRQARQVGHVEISGQQTGTKRCCMSTAGRVNLSLSHRFVAILLHQSIVESRIDICNKPYEERRRIESMPRSSKGQLLDGRKGGIWRACLKFRVRLGGFS